ncbi:MAG: hypothetical protein KF729_19475 [Sandaracinaceae bacterium]|nr:hypothetical protein [Sandaracinaceae bacterium]
MSFQIRLWAVPALATAVVSFGCIEREGRPVNPCTNVTIGQAIQVTNVDKVDLLFMVDNSNSMAEEQASLTAEFPRLINILATGDFDQDGNNDGEDDFEPVVDLNVGVINSDMGVGGFTVPTCARADFGDDGILQTRGRTDIMGCMATYPNVLNFRPASGGDPAGFARDVACVATLGTGGCGFEQQLDAILKAVSPSAATTWTAAGFNPPRFFRDTFGHADGANNGFVRDDSVLAIIPLTDEEDCSALNPEIYNPSSATYGGTDLNLRCFAYPETLHPVSRYVDGLLQLRTRPGLLIYAPIVGIPVDLTPAAGARPDWDRLVSDNFDLRDDRMEERVDPSMPSRLVPSCNVPGRGIAFPPVRIVQVARGLEARGAGVTVQSICQDSFRGALGEVIRQIKSALGAACLPRRLNLEADGSVACDVVVVMPSGMGCGDLAGGTPKMEGGRAVFEGDRPVCVLAQQVPANRSPGAPAPTAPGWYYDTFTDDGRMNCETSPANPWQRIAFSAQPPSGAEVRLECFQSVQSGGTGPVTVGTFCDPSTGQTITDSPMPCSSGNLGGVSLGCDPNTRACGVPCASTADCRGSGLVGYVCDTRPLQSVNPDQFPGNTNPYNFCVNPTCG